MPAQFRLPISHLVVLLSILTHATSWAAYIDILNSFENTRGNQWVVAGGSFDDIESAFGTRIQSATGSYDFHRGIDVDGTQGDNILAPTDGIFWEYREFTFAGHTVILRHDLDSTVTFNGRNYDHYYTYYSHLFDDGAGGTSGTDDVIASWTPEVTAISAGQLIGHMGNSGASPGGGSNTVHLHMELRFGTRSSLQFQTENPGNTQHGFDPHMNPMLLFEPYTYATSGAQVYHQSATLNGNAMAGNDIQFDIAYTNDDMPLLNAVTVTLEEIATGNAVKTHTLDLNQRIGFDATSTANLDTPDTTKPYFDPVTPGLTASEYVNEVIVPGAWTSGFGSGDHQLEVTISDLWQNSETTTITVVPEPHHFGLLTATLLAAQVAYRRRSLSRNRLSV